MKLSIGMDIGSTSTELVIMNEKYEILHLGKTPTGIYMNQTGNQLLAEGLKKSNINPNTGFPVVVTGYGRKQLTLPAGNKKSEKTEISCYARGASFLNNKIRTIIDIGGQDSKAISIDENGKVKDFAMNDKCAAGTGKFLEMICKRFEIEPDEMGAFSMKSGKEVHISSICAVFTETEVISLISGGTRLEDILKAVEVSLVKRIIGLVERVGIKEEIMFCGGVARNVGVARTLEEYLKRPLFLPKFVEFVGAIGASLYGLNQ